MGQVKYEECNRCPVRNGCNIAVEPGSVMCSMNRFRSGATHGDTETSRRVCPHCGKPI